MHWTKKSYIAERRTHKCISKDTKQISVYPIYGEVPGLQYTKSKPNVSVDSAEKDAQHLRQEMKASIDQIKEMRAYAYDFIVYWIIAQWDQRIDKS